MKRSENRILPEPHLNTFPIKPQVWHKVLDSSTIRLADLTIGVMRQHFILAVIESEKRTHLTSYHPCHGMLPLQWKTWKTINDVINNIVRSHERRRADREALRKTQKIIPALSDK